MYNKVIIKGCDWSNLTSAEKSNKYHMISQGACIRSVYLFNVFKLRKKYTVDADIIINLQIRTYFVSHHFLFVSLNNVWKKVNNNACLCI